MACCLRPVLAAFLVIFGLGSKQSSWAQMGSTIMGTIRDGSGAAVSGADVSLESHNLPEGVQTTVANDRGVYRFPDLSPASYDLTATRAGLQAVTRANLRVPVGTTLTVDFVLRERGASARITVNEPGPVVDVTSPSLTTQFGREELESLPFDRINGVLALTPGVTGRSALGSGPDTNQSMIDGSATVLTFRGGTAGVAIHPYWVEEVQVVAVGANANSGEFSGVVGNVALRSGSNRLSGLFEFRTTPSTWQADNRNSLPDTLREQFRPEEIVSRWATNAQAGGPIRRDRLFFFSGLLYTRNTSFSAGSLATTPQESRWPVVFTKITGTLTRNVNVEGFVNRDEFHSKGGLGRNQLPETAGQTDALVYAWNGRVTWTATSRTLVEVRTNGLDFRLTSLPTERRAGPPPRRDRITQIMSGNAGTFADEFARRIQAGAGVTRFVDGVFGNGHEFQAGVEYDRLTFHTVSGYPGGRFYMDAGGLPELVLLWDGSTIDSTGARTTIYLQNQWRATSRVSIHAGARMAFNRGSVPNKGTVFKTRPISPRLALAWDVGSDHKTVVRAGFSRLHEGLSPTTWDFLSTSGVTPTITARVLGPDTFQELMRSATVNVALDENVAHAHVDQYLVGIEREVLPSVSLKVQYVRRHFNEIWAFIDTGSRYGPVERRDPGPDGLPGTADDGAVLTVYNVLNPNQQFPVLTNPDQAFRRYDAVQVIGEKHVSGDWQLLAGYTWSRTRGTVGNAGGENRAAGGDTGRGGNFFNPNRAINAEGRPNPDSPHQVNLQGTYFVRAWGGANISGSYQYLSGRAWERSATLTGFAQGNITVRVEPRGTRRGDAGSTLALRLEKTIPLRGPGRTAGIYVDLFNVMNQGVPVGIQALSGATFGQPSQWSQPRTVQVAVRVKF